MSAGLHPVLTVTSPRVESDSTLAILQRLQDARPVESDSTPQRVHACTAAQMAAEAGVSRRMIFLGLKVRRAGCDEIHAMLRDGRLSMNLAAVLVDLFPSHDDQRTVLAEFATLPAREWLGFARLVAALMKGGAPC